MRDGTFPRPMNISKRLVVWPERYIAEWQAAKIAANDKAVGRQR
jgi:predicted DNA-binding transcriptional regulator AlpA